MFKVCSHPVHQLTWLWGQHHGDEVGRLRQEESRPESGLSAWSDQEPTRFIRTGERMHYAGYCVLFCTRHVNSPCVHLSLVLWCLPPLSPHRLRHLST